jgi:hypothetical protein
MGKWVPAGPTYKIESNKGVVGNVRVTPEVVALVIMIDLEFGVVDHGASKHVQA